MRKRGFTLPELLIVMAILAILWAIASVTLVRVQTTASLDTSLTLLVSDIKSQQTKAMAGENLNSYGVYFEANRYTLFTGTSFNPADPGNFSMEIKEPTRVSNTSFPGSVVIFEVGSGEVSGFVLGQDSVTVEDSVSGETVVLKFNKYGAIEQN